MAKYKNLTLGQVEAVVNKMGGMDKLEAFLRGEYEMTPIAQAGWKFLESLGEVAVKIPQLRDDRSFFKTRDGLCVDDDFIISFVGGTVQFTTIVASLSAYKVKKNAHDHEIRSELPKNHVFEANKFCQILIVLLTKQWGGKDGDLLNNGSANIFYVWDKDKKQIFVVNVLWSTDHSGWVVEVWGLDVILWGAEDLVFTCN